MAFVNQQDVIKTFEGLIKYLFEKEKNIYFKGDFQKFPMKKQSKDLDLINRI